MLYPAHRHHLRWPLIPLAYLGGMLIPPGLMEIAWELYLLDWPLVVVEVGKSVVGGFCSVYFAGAIAPRGHTIVAAVCFTATIVFLVTVGAIAPISFGVFHWLNVAVLCVSSAIAVVIIARLNKEATT